MVCIPVSGLNSDRRNKRVAYICTSDEPESMWTKKCNVAPDCPNEEAHTACPRGYSSWFTWAARMGRTHRQIRCSGCQLLAIWVPIVRRGPRKEKTPSKRLGRPPLRPVQRGTLIAHR